MKFAEIGYIKDSEKPWISEFILRLPKKLRDSYFLIFAPIKIEPLEIAGEAGCKITVPMDAREMDYALQQRMIKRITAFLMDKNIQLIINEDLIPMPKEYIQARGSLALAYYVPDLIKRYYKKNHLDLQRAKVVVKDGGNLETFMVLKRLLGEVNFLSICTAEAERFKEYFDEAYEETGLVVEFFVNPKGSVMQEADIVINCSADMENFDYSLKKNSLYIEASPMKRKLKRLMGRRQDISFVHEVQTKYNEEILNSAYTEVIFILKCRNILETLQNTGKAKAKDEIIRCLNRLTLDIEG